MGFAVSEAVAGNYVDAIEAIDEAAAVGGAAYLVSWVKAVIYAAAQRWIDVIDEVKNAESWPDPFLASAGRVAHGVAAANLGLFNEAERRLMEANSLPAGAACSAVIAWYLAMTRRALGNEDGAVALLEWLQATHASPKVAEALKNPGYRLTTTTAESIRSRTDAWDPGSVVADNSGREALLSEAQADLDRQIGLSRVKEQVDRYRAATQLAKVRGARGMKVGQSSRHMIFTGPPGTGKTTIARVVANILAGLGVIAEPKLVETSRKDFVAEYEGQSAVKTTKTIDRVVITVREVGDLIQLITSATKEQATGIAQVNEAVTQLDTVTQQNAALVEECLDDARAHAKRKGRSLPPLEDLPCGILESEALEPYLKRWKRDIAAAAAAAAAAPTRARCAYPRMD
jgi:type VII secretion ATPase EccA